MTADEFLAAHPAVTQESERLFVREFLYPLLGEAIQKIEPQRPFIDRSGSSRRIDFAFVDEASKLAREVNGETYHAEGIIPDEMFDENLFRQNEILAAKYRLIRFSYSQLQAPRWRPLVMDSLREFFTQYTPQLLKETPLRPNSAQEEALQPCGFIEIVADIAVGSSFCRLEPAKPCYRRWTLTALAGVFYSWYIGLISLSKALMHLFAFAQW